MRDLFAKNIWGLCNFIYDIFKITLYLLNKMIKNHNFLMWSFSVNWSRVIYIIFDINLSSINLNLHDLINNIVKQFTLIDSFWIYTYL